MSEAPLCVPVELSRGDEGPRWFRLAVAISPQGLRLRLPLPEALREGLIVLRLHLPAPAPGLPPISVAPLVLRGEAAPPADEDEEQRGTHRVVFCQLTEVDRLPLLRYAEAR